DHGDHRTGEPVPGKFEFFFRDSTHRQRWQTAKGDTLADAKAERAEMVARLHRGERVERTKRTVGEAAQAWLERGRGQRGPWDPVTRERYERVVRRHVLGSADPQRRPLGEVKLRDLTPDHVAEWSQRNEQTLARDTAQLALIALNQIFRFAVRRGWMGANPVACLEPGEKPSGTRGEVRILDERDLGRLVAHAGPYRVLFAFLPYCGLRIGETLGLRWCDLNLDAGPPRPPAALPPPRPEAVEDARCPALPPLAASHLRLAPHRQGARRGVRLPPARAREPGSHAQGPGAARGEAGGTHRARQRVRTRVELDRVAASTRRHREVDLDVRHRPTRGSGDACTSLGCEVGGDDAEREELVCGVLV